MQQQASDAMNSASTVPLSYVSTEQIQKHLDENKNLILAILESQKTGKVSECAHYQAILQKNLMYLAAIADAQPQGSSQPSQVTQLAINSMPSQGTTPHMLHSQTSKMPQPGATPIPKLPFQLNALRGQEQQNQQLLQFQQQQQQLQGGHFSVGSSSNGLHPSIQHGMMDMRGSHQLDGSSGMSNSASKPSE